MKIYKEHKAQLNRRYFFIFTIKLTLLLAIATRFSFLQLFGSTKYSSMAQKNRVRFLPIYPRRGRILSRKNNVLADSAAIKNLVLSYQKVSLYEAVEHFMQKIFQLETNITYKQINDAKYYRKDIVLIRDLSWKQIEKLHKHNYQGKGLSIVNDYKRSYQYKKNLFHVLGYTGKGDGIIPVGKSSLEYHFNNSLAGKIGYRKVLVSARNKVVEDLDVEPVIQGKDIHTTLDVGISQICLESFGDSVGSVIITEVDTGRVLTMNSFPTIDTNLMSVNLDTTTWSNILNDKNKPLLNRCVDAMYPPGSVFKLVVALAALEYGINPKTKHTCTGEHKVGNNQYKKCAKKEGHGSLNCVDAISYSCNVYFYKIAQQIGIENIWKVANSLGLCTKTGIELSKEASGLIPSKDWKLRTFQESWMIGDTANVSIGQGYVLLTPLQIAMMTARIASGKKVVPTLIASDNTEFENLPLNPANLSIVRKGMRASAVRGNARFANPSSKDIQMYGKTGTAEVSGLIDGQKFLDHAIFSGFFNVHKKRYTITVVLEHKGWASRHAAPLARKIAQKMYDRQLV